jgi:Protein of unknown function (DUF1552)
MIVRKLHMPRRTVLGGLGAALALPLLDAMVPAFTAERLTAAAPVRRWAIFYVPNGMAMQQWTPAGNGDAFELSPTLEPLAPFRDRLLVLSGLADLAAMPRPEDGPGDHARAAGTFLTAVHIRKSAGAPEAGISVDQIAAQALGRDTQIPSLELGIDTAKGAGNCDSGYSCAYMNTLAWRGPKTQLPPESDPRALFERLFGAGADAAARLARMREERSLLDAVMQKMAAVNRRLGATDRAKLDEYFESVRGVERRIQKAEEQNLDLPELEAPVAIPAAYTDHVGLMFDLLALAYQADLTRVSTFIFAREGSTRTYPEAGVSEAHHPLSHHGNDPEKLEQLSHINRYHVRLFASFVERLAARRDGNGSLLDNSLLLYGTGISDSNRHLHEDLPIALVSGASIGISAGRHVRYPKRTPIANLYVSALDRLGVPEGAFGDSTGRVADL